MAKSLRHFVALSVLLAAELLQVSGDAVISTSKILTDNSKNSLTKMLWNSVTCFGGRENSEALQNRFIAYVVITQKPKSQSLD